MAKKELLVLTTPATRKTILDDGGVGHFTINPARVERTVEYVVICRQAGWENRWEEDIDRGSAFLIGRLKHLTQAGRDGKGASRYFVSFSEYAELNIRDFWNARQKNPVSYMDANAIDLKDLQFKGLVNWRPVDSSPIKPGQKLTIAQAKKALALSLNLPEESIQIIIRG